jgi:hypothetical protein
MKSRGLILLTCSVIMVTNVLTGGATTKDFDWAYAQDMFWPTHVTPSEAVLDDSGNIVLQANIPVVLIRAYEDGKLCLIDRTGNILINYAITNFVEQIETTLASEQRAKTKIMLNQLGRRIYDYSYDRSKAVSEKELAKYSAFMVVRTPSNKESLEATIAAIRDQLEEIDTKKICPVLIFDELMPNKVFYERVNELKVPYPVVAPIFQQGTVNALFSEREKSSRAILISISGKLLDKWTTL